LDFSSPVYPQGCHGYDLFPDLLDPESPSGQKQRDPQR